MKQNLRTVIINKKGFIEFPKEVIEKLGINIKIDAIGFIWEKGEIKLKILRGPK